MATTEFIPLNSKARCPCRDVIKEFYDLARGRATTVHYMDCIVHTSHEAKMSKNCSKIRSLTSIENSLKVGTRIHGMYVLQLE